MSQLNLKQILSGDNLSVVVDKLNYNFNQIILNGGGPQGLRGFFGAPGLPGLQGLQGTTGPAGEHGTYIFADSQGPTAYPFGTGGGPLPRIGDIYIDAEPTSLTVYELAPTGASSTYWNLIQTITSPSSSFVDVYHQSGAGPDYTDIANDVTKATKLFIGSSSSFLTGVEPDYFFALGFSDLTLNGSLGLPSPYADSVSTFASEKNQIRILSNGLAGATGALGGTGTVPSISNNRGGVIHSLEATFAGGATVQVYKIGNADIFGEKFFELGFNPAVGSSLLYGDMLNRLGVSIPGFTTPLVANLSVNRSLAIGSPITGFYSNTIFNNNEGAIIEGNLAIGITGNSLATGTFYGATSGSVLIDVPTSSSLPNASSLYLSSNYAAGTNTNWWRFNHDARSASSNNNFGSLVLTAFRTGLTGAGITSQKDVLWMGLTAHNNVLSTFVGVDNSAPLEKLHIGTKLVYHDDNSGNTSSKFIGFNARYNYSTNYVNRISGATSAQEGFVRIAFEEMGLTSQASLTRFTNAGVKLAIDVGNLGYTATSSAYDNPISGRTYRGVVISPPLVGPTSSFYNLSYNVPQVGIGIPLDLSTSVGSTAGADSAYSPKRGTVAIASQFRTKPNPIGPFGMTIEDPYNIGLYTYDGYPSAGLRVSGGATASTTTKSFGIDFIGATGDHLFEDISLLYADTDVNLLKRYQRRAYFGDSFRIGINEVPNWINSPLDGTTYGGTNAFDIAPLVVSGATAFYIGGNSLVHPASIHRGSVIIDQTPFGGNDGGLEGLWFRCAGVTGNYYKPSSPIPVNTYAGDYTIRYGKTHAESAGSPTPSDWGGGVSGLIFSGIGATTLHGGLTQAVIISDDSGHVPSIGVGTDKFDFSSLPVTIWGFLGSTSGVPATDTFRASISTTGIIKCLAVNTVSDITEKENVIDITSPLDRLLTLRGVNFTWKKSGLPDAGFIAQEVEEVFPELIRIETATNKRSLNYNGFSAIIVEAIKEQQKIIEEKDARIKNLEDKLSRIEELLAKNNIA